MRGAPGAQPAALRPWSLLPTRRSRRARSRARRARPPPRVHAAASSGPKTASAVVGDLLDAAADAAKSATSTIPDVMTSRPYEYRVHTDTHFFPGLRQYESIGLTVDVPAVLAASLVFTVACVLLFSQLWERVWKERVFPEEAGLDADGNPRDPNASGPRFPRVLCGVDCSAYPIFDAPKIRRAAAFAERWHHGQYRRSGEPYVAHAVESARILAAMLPPGNAGRKYVDAVAACVLHDVVDDTECELEDVEEEFGPAVAALVAGVSTLGKLPQVLRRSQRVRSGAGGAGASEGSDGNDSAARSEKASDDGGRMDTAELASLRRLLWFQVEDPRCFLIKFADRTHNMRTIYAVDPEKAKGVANETLQVWCYFAEQMGMFATKAELEDLSFAVRDPAAFRAVIDARIDEWVVNEGVDAESRREAKKKRKAKEEEEARRLRELGTAENENENEAAEETAAARAEGRGAETARSGRVGDAASGDFARGGGDGDPETAPENPSRRAYKMEWEPPTGEDVRLFFERVLRGENAGAPRFRDEAALRAARAAEAALMVASARAAVREEERQKRAEPTTPAQDELRALLECVPPFDLLTASERSGGSATASEAADAALRGADAATARAASASSGWAGADPEADPRTSLGGASLEASLRALRVCENTTLRSLQLDAVAPGLRVEITSRLKSAYSTHLKMRRKATGFGRVCDARALRVVVGESPSPAPLVDGDLSGGATPREDAASSSSSGTAGTPEEVEACFALLNAIHKLYRPVPGEYDDYVTNPKPSGYRSLHTAVEGPDGALLEFQVRTRAMHEAAEFGDAAHWLYKDFVAEADNAEAEARAAAGTAGAARERADASTTRSRSLAAANIERRSAFSAPSDRSGLDASAPASLAVGQPVQIVRSDVVRGGAGRLSAGTTAWREGSRAHVVEPERGDEWALGGAGAGGAEDVAAWVAAGAHDAALRRAASAGRVSPRQTGPGYKVLEFALCADGRWHEVDSYGRKLATLANPLDPEALAREHATFLSRGEEKEKEEEEEEEEDVVTFVSTSEADSEAAGRPSLASPDELEVTHRVRAMQAATRAYLADVDVAFDFDGERDDEVYVFEDDEEGSEGFRSPSGLGRFAGAAVVDDAGAGLFDSAFAAGTSTLTAEEAVRRARRELEARAEAAAREAAAERRRSRRGRAEAEAEARREKEGGLIFSIAKARAAGGARDAGAGVGGAEEEEKEKEEEARVAPSSKTKSSSLFSPSEAERLERDLGMARPDGGGSSRDGSPTVSVDEENVLVIAWVAKDEGEAREAVQLKVPKGVTAAQLREAGEFAAAADPGGGRRGADGREPEGPEGGDRGEEAAADLVNVNMELVPSDTPLNAGDQVFLKE